MPSDEINNRPRKGLGVRSPLAVPGTADQQPSTLHPHSLNPRVLQGLNPPDKTPTIPQALRQATATMTVAVNKDKGTKP
jgi:hypothetical protein